VARFILRFAIVASAIGLVMSLAGHAWSFRAGHDVAPPWFLAVFLAVFPLGLVGVYVCYQVGTTHGVWGSRDQWAFFDRSMGAWWSRIRTIAFLYAILRFAWFAVIDLSDPAEDYGIPLGLSSAFTVVFYLTLVMILKVALGDSAVFPAANNPPQSAGDGSTARQLEKTVSASQRRRRRQLPLGFLPQPTQVLHGAKAEDLPAPANLRLQPAAAGAIMNRRRIPFDVTAGRRRAPRRQLDEGR